MGIFRRIKDRKLHSSTGPVPVKPPVLERLEPRILLSGDGLLSIAPPDPFQDTPQVVQYAELLETEEQVEEEIGAELDPSDTLNADVCQPILTLFVDDNTNDENETADDLSIVNVGPVQTGDDIAILSDHLSGNTDDKILATEIVDAEEPMTNSPAFPTEDGSMPIHTNDADVSIEYATSIEIRGPPGSESAYSTTYDINAYAVSDEFAETSDVECICQFKIPDLPGLRLVDPDISSWQGQIVYLDFDGAEDVTYNGPVVIENINVSEFSSEAAGLSGQEQENISQILTTLEQIFEGSGVQFTTSKPDSSMSYSTVFIGGDATEFREYGFFVGLAEKVDAGNQDSTDTAFVFSDVFAREISSSETLITRMVDTIAHEVGHLLGYEHHYDPAVQEGALSTVAAEYVVDSLSDTVGQ
ncbi:MAG: LEPR-XLL domain-containing protein, partial [Deltaproteobacteria bacterium]|nr:LEPR-XLL domain-containing protein [Deltaproteobacteria bacterium]